MSKLLETKQAYDRVRAMLEQQLLARGSNAQQVKDCQAAVDAAFYLLGWAQFEYLTRKEAEIKIEAEARGRTIHGGAWRYIKDNIRSFSVRRKLEIIFFGDQQILKKLNADYDIRNEAAHNYKKLPSEVSDISAWLDHLEDLVGKF